MATVFSSVSEFVRIPTNINIMSTIKLIYEITGDNILQNFAVIPHEINVISAYLNFSERIAHFDLFYF